MIPLIADNQTAIDALCRQYGVQKLGVFGSAVNGTFHDDSDFDFVIEFDDYGPGISRRFIDFANALEAMFKRPVDLVFESKLTNPYFRRSVLATMEVIFDGRTNRDAVA